MAQLKRVTRPFGEVNVTPAERNRRVPRGREVALAEVLRDLPKAPPGRRAPS